MDPQTDRFQNSFNGFPVLALWQGANPGEVADRISAYRNEAEISYDGSGALTRLSAGSLERLAEEGRTGIFRAAATAYTESEFADKLSRMEDRIRKNPEKPFSFPAAGMFYGSGDRAGRLAFLFPGQGSQYPGMGGPLAGAFPAACRVWEELGSMRFSGKSIREVVFPDEPSGPQDANAAFIRLSSADWTNACISVAAEAVLALFERMGVFPDAVGGHSFGDISAFRAAGVFGPEDMIRHARYRGELGVNCPKTTTGCILVVPDNAENSRKILKKAAVENVWIANYNAPDQTVLAGVKEDVFRAGKAFEEHGISAKTMPISGAPHCPLIEDVAREFHEYLAEAELRPAGCDIYSFLFGRKIDNDPAVFRKVLKAHIEKPVRFMQMIENMYKDGVRIFVEIGPANVLASMVGRILGTRPHAAFATDHRKADPVLVFLNTVAGLFKEGLVSDPAVLIQEFSAHGSEGSLPAAGQNGVSGFALDQSV
ncbi:MAG: acyltransferase domain-containing protein [Desulfosalsimonas sp.]